MRKIYLESVVLNSSGTGEKLERAKKMLKYITGSEPKVRKARKRIPSFGIRPGLEIGCVVTVRGKAAEELLKKLFDAIGSKLKKRQVGQGFINFGIAEYIQLKDFPFRREIGILGFDVSARLARPGFCIKKRKHARARIPARHKISKAETEKFFEEKFNVVIE